MALYILANVSTMLEECGRGSLLLVIVYNGDLKNIFEPWLV